MTLAQETTFRVAGAMAARIDAVLGQAVSMAIGDEWTMTTIAGRLRSVREGRNTFEVIYLDDQPILELHDPVISTIFSHEKGWMQTVTQAHRVLARRNG